MSEELSIEARPENIDAVIDFIFDRLGDCPPKTRNQIGVAVDEVFSNIIRYAYHPLVGGALVRVAVDDEITIEFEDKGVAHDPLSAPAPDFSIAPDFREEGGLGVFLLKNIMDSVAYRREGDKNILTIVKRL